MGDQPRWLNADERRIWLGWVFTTRLLWEEIERDLQRDSDFSFGHYEILVMLSETPATPMVTSAGTSWARMAVAFRVAVFIPASVNVSL